MDDIEMSVKTALKRTVIRCFKFVFRFIYFICSSFRKTDKDKAVFVLSRSEELDGNLKYIHDELMNQQPHVKIQFIYAENRLNLNLFREMILFSNATYLILEDYYLPIYLIKPNQSLKVIQLWHAAGAFKKFGYSTANTKFGSSRSYLKLIPIHSNYTHVYVSSSRIVPYYAEAFNMSSKRIFPIGLPRNDFFNESEKIDEVKSKIYLEYPNVKKRNRINILIAPTYRAHGRYQETESNFIDVLIKISKYVEQNVQIIFKAHPYMSDEELLRLSGIKNIICATKYSLNEWMLIADAFVTDYSSAIFDFSILNKPLAHFVTDIDEYATSRGLYEDLEVISDGEIIKEEEKLITWINTREKNEYYETKRMIAYNFDNTKNVASRVVSHFTRY